MQLEVFDVRQPLQHQVDEHRDDENGERERQVRAGVGHHGRLADDPFFELSDFRGADAHGYERLVRPARRITIGVDAA